MYEFIDICSQLFMDLYQVKLLLIYINRNSTRANWHRIATCTASGCSIIEICSFKEM